ncbi:NOI4-like protein [Drosera capensis]
MASAKPLPKFGEWDVNDPSSAEDFSIIFNKARTEKKLGSQTDSLSKPESLPNHATVLGKPPPSRKWFCCV